MWRKGGQVNKLDWNSGWVCSFPSLQQMTVPAWTLALFRVMSSPVPDSLLALGQGNRWKEKKKWILQREKKKEAESLQILPQRPQGRGEDAAVDWPEPRTGQEAEDERPASRTGGEQEPVGLGQPEGQLPKGIRSQAMDRTVPSA